MKLPSCLQALFLAVIAAPSSAADRNFGVSGFERVRVEGPYIVHVKVGVAPFARAKGSPRAIDTVAIDVQGRTLIVRQRQSGWGGYPSETVGPVEITIGTHELSAAWLNGAGSLAIDRIRGLSFELSVHGSGSASIDRVDVDQFKLAVAGSGSASLAGRSARLSASIRGSSTLEAAPLMVKDATVGVEGPATIRASISGTAKVDAMGASQVEIAGKPACTVRTSGSATVIGCK